MTKFAFSAENKPKVKEILAKYPKSQAVSAVMPLLDLAQRQNDGWISQDIIEHVAELIEKHPMHVMEVTSFYTMYNTKPVGKHHVQVCTTTPCWLRGSDDVLGACKKKLGIKIGEVTTDGQFSLVETECLGACVNAPMVQINDDYYEDLTAESMENILNDLAAGKKVKTGPQIERQTSAPQGGLTTLLSKKKEASK
jgi:NADH-quinone oxidoreductase E subunit